MRFMMLMIPKVYQGNNGQKAGRDFIPSAEAVSKMTKFNEELARAVALISLDGLHPPASGARITFSEGKSKVIEGPFKESKDVIGGYWIIQVRSREEAIQWAKRVPAENGDIIEVRQIFETAEFPEEVQKAAKNPTVQAQIEMHEQS